MFNIDESLRNRCVECARGIANWICNTQYPHRDDEPRAGAMPWVVRDDGSEHFGNNWNMAFATMGLLSAHKAFGEARYERAALRMGRYLKTLQIFSPFKPDQYGAIREMTPQTPWCYTRDALSVGWAFIELYRHTKDDEYLERARLWGEWFVAHGCDEEGYPLWGHQFEPYFENRRPQMRNDTQGSFQGGSLNFLYHLARETKDDKWVGEPLKRIADNFVTYNQQPTGFYCTVLRDTKKPPEADPQGGLHRANDDLGSLGLLGAYKLTNDARYLVSIEKFLTAVFEAQQDDGMFEESVACIPVVLNILHEVGDLVNVKSMRPKAVELALEALVSSQSQGLVDARTAGGLIEIPARGRQVCGRSSCYALIVLLKLFKDVEGFLTVK